MIHSHRNIFITVFFITTLVILMPTPAHASWLTDPGGEFLNLLVGLMEAIHSILIKIIVWLGNVLQWVIGLEVNYGGAAVYNVWKIFRDICNSLFIVFFIVIAFSTMFNSLVPSLKAYYWSSALQKVVLAALLINFSLPIGQTIVWAGNQAAGMVSGLLSGTNIGATIREQGSVFQVTTGFNGISLSAVPFENVPDDQLDAAQRIAKRNYQGQAKIMLDNCIKYAQAPIAECGERAARQQALQTAADVDQAIGKLKQESVPTFSSVLNNAWLYWSNVAAGGLGGAVDGAITGGASGGVFGGISGAVSSAKIAPNPTATEPTKVSASANAQSFLSLLINNFFLGILALNFLVVVGFLLIRIPATWVYLSVSAMAFFTIALPKAKEWKAWFGNIIGWSIFAPLYLFAIYIGMFVLNQQGALLSGLKDAGAFASILGIGLFYLISGFIFIGGAKVAWDTAFKLSSDLKTYGGGFADSLGVSEKSYFGAATVANTIGLTSSYQARKAQVEQIGGDIATGTRGRFPGLFRSQEESTALLKEKIGVRGAGAEVEKLTAKRVNQQKTILEGNKTDDEGLRAVFNGGNRDASLAAGEILLKKGKLKTTEERKKLLDKYGSISPVARKEALKRVVEQYKKDEYKSEKDALDALDAIKEDDKAFKDLLKTIEKNQPLLYAKLANAGLVFAEDGTTKLSMTEVLEKKASKLSDTEFIELYKEGKIKDLGENLNYVWKSKLKNPKELQGLLRASDKETRAKLRAETEPDQPTQTP